MILLINFLLIAELPFFVKSVWGREVLPRTKKITNQLNHLTLEKDDSQLSREEGCPYYMLKNHPSAAYKWMPSFLCVAR